MTLEETTGPNTKRRDTVLILLSVLALAAFLRFYRLDDQSLWYDEAYTASVTDPATSSLSYIWSSGPVALHAPSSPYARLPVQTGGHWEWSLRLPSVLAGILTVLAVYLVGSYCFNRRVGALSSLAVAVSTFHVYYSQEARPYSLLMLFALASTYCLLRAVREQRRVWWVAYAALVAMGLYTHLYMAFVILVQNTFLLWQWKEKRVSGRAWGLSQVCPPFRFSPGR